MNLQILENEISDRTLRACLCIIDLLLLPPKAMMRWVFISTAQMINLVKPNDVSTSSFLLHETQTLTSLPIISPAATKMLSLGELIKYQYVTTLLRGQMRGHTYIIIFHNLFACKEGKYWHCFCASHSTGGFDLHLARILRHTFTLSCAPRLALLLSVFCAILSKTRVLLKW
jgi:hypothetical protein